MKPDQARVISDKLQTPWRTPLAKLIDLSVSFLSLVKTPATGKGLTLKSAKSGERPQAFELVVKNDDMMRAYGIVYAPDQEDAHGDTADADTIRRAAAEFMREGRLKNIDTEHSFTAEMAFVAESWLVRKGDSLFPDEPEGAWAVGIQIGDPDLWKQLKSGDLTGISLAGIARQRPEPEDPAFPTYTEKDAPSWFASLIKALGGAQTQEPIEETDMDKNEVQQIVRDTLKSEVGDTVKEALKAAGLGPAKEEPTDVQKAVAAALKAAGIEPKEEPNEIEKAVAAALKAHGIEPKAPAGETGVTKSLDTQIEDAVTKALAKGAVESDPSTGDAVEGFL
jgi:hypothetical protein